MIWIYIWTDKKVIKTTQHKRPRKYFAPQNGGVHHKCDSPGCDKAGEFKAPKDSSLKSYYWFCLEHVQEYNAKWNYYTDENEAPEYETFRNKTRFSGFHSKIKYKFGCDLEEDLEFLHSFSGFKKAKGEMRFSREERAEMQLLDINPDEFSVETLKKQYKKLAKTCHPDLNPDDSAAEEKFKRLTKAYKMLLEKMS